MKNSRLLIAFLVFTLLLGIGVGAGAQRLPRNETLYKAGMQWGPPTNFSPFGGNVAWSINNEVLVYETLFTYNLVTGKLDQLLGKEYKWIDDDMTLQVTLHDGTKWQDGEVLDADDVVYTIKLGDKYSTNFSQIWNYITDVVAVDDRTVQLFLNPERPHRAYLENFLSTIRIVPEHIWTKVEEEDGTVTRTPNTSPVGSGPFKLMNYNPEMIVLERDDNYWGKAIYGEIAPRYIAHPVFRSNDAGNLALERGQVDLSQQFIPEVWKMWEERGLPVGTWFDEEPYYLPASIPSLVISYEYPLNIPEVRRALAFATDYARIAETAMSRYSVPKAPGFLIHEGAPEAKYYSEEDAKEYGWEYNPAKAVEILESIGAKRGDDGIFVLEDGTRLGPFDVVVPYGWTDWMTAVEIFASNAQAVGIDVRTSFPDAPVRMDMMQTGNFDIIMDSPGGGYGLAHPWQRFRDVMDDRTSNPIGQINYANYNRYSNPKANELLDRIAFSTDEKEIAEVYRELNILFMQDIPVLPLMHRPWEFWTFNERVWTGFPTSDNPTAPPQHNHSGIKVYYQIEPAR